MVVSQYHVNLWPDGRPDLAPNLRPRLSQRIGMTLPQQRSIRVVINIDQILAPPDKHRVARSEDDPHRGLEALRPGLPWPQRGLRPIEGPDPFPHLAAANQEIVRRLVFALHGFPDHVLSHLGYSLFAVEHFPDGSIQF